MGGNAIKQSRRISLDEYHSLVDSLYFSLPELIMKPTLYYKSKEDFGDIDMVVQLLEGEDLKSLIIDRLQSLEFINNGPYLSILYKEVQVDFIFASKDNFETQWTYMNWNDISNFFGRVARGINFKFGHDGLSYEMHLSDHYKLSVVVSKDMPKILEFLGYNPEKYFEGFNDPKDIYDYVISSPLFNPVYFSLENQSNFDRVRNKKRKMYQGMIAYIEENKLHNKEKLSDEEKNIFYNKAIEMFGDNFHYEILEKIEQYNKSVYAKSLFNGDIIKKLTGLEGKELGAFKSRIYQLEENLNNRIIEGGPIFVENLILSYKDKI